MTPHPRRPVIELMDPMVVEILRKKTPQERLQIAFDMWETARVILQGAVMHDHPDWNEEQINREIARRISHGVVNGRK